MRQGSLPVKVVYGPGRGAWARYVLERTLAYLPALESYLGVEIPFGKQIRIEGHRRVMLNGIWYGGTNWPLGTLRIEYNLLRIGQPGLLYHELGHCWFALRGKPELPWMVEGMVSYLPLAMAPSWMAILPDGSGFDPGGPGTRWGIPAAGLPWTWRAYRTWSATGCCM